MHELLAKPEGAPIFIEIGMLCSPIECGQRHPTPLPLGRFLTKLGMRVSAIYSSFLPTVTPGDGLVWPDLEDDVVTAVQCSVFRPVDAQSFQLLRE